MPVISPTDVRETGTGFAARSVFCRKCQDDGDASRLESAIMCSRADYRRAGRFRVKGVAQPSGVERLCQCLHKTMCRCPRYSPATVRAQSCALSSFFDQLVARRVEVLQMANLELDEDVRRSGAGRYVLFGSRRVEQCLSCSATLSTSCLEQLAIVREATARELLHGRNLQEVYDVLSAGTVGAGTSSLGREDPNSVADRMFELLLDCIAGKPFLKVVTRNLRSWVARETLAKISEEARAAVQDVAEPIREMRMAHSVIVAARKALIESPSTPLEARTFEA